MTDPDVTPPTVRKAVLLAAGRGTRMRDLTLDLPKPMLPVRGRPILDYIVTGLKAAGIAEVLIVVGYRADVVTDYFGDGSGHGLNVSYATQVTQDGTGRVVELAKDFAGGDGFVLSYGDILIDPANYQVLTTPGDEEGIVTVKHSDDVSKGGAVFVNERFDLTDLREKPEPRRADQPRGITRASTFSARVFSSGRRACKSPCAASTN